MERRYMCGGNLSLLQFHIFYLKAKESRLEARGQICHQIGIIDGETRLILKVNFEL
jgi:hypothetical protein